MELTGDTEVEDLAREDELVEAIHDLLDGRVPVPPMEVKDVDVRGVKFGGRRVEGDAHALDVVARLVGLDRDICDTLEVLRVLQ